MSLTVAFEVARRERLEDDPGDAGRVIWCSVSSVT
jgi:hypothetical protein